MTERAILLVDDEVDALEAYTQALRRERYRIDATADPREALTRVRSVSYDAAVVDLRMPHMSGMDLLRGIHAADPDVALVVVTGFASVDSAVEAMKEGACDYLSKPFTPDDLRLGLRRALARHDLVRENHDLRERLGAPRGRAVIVGESAKLEEVRRLVSRVAPTDCTVLVYGETGTGKELVAREIHARSAPARRNRSSASTAPRSHPSSSSPSCSATSGARSPVPFAGARARSSSPTAARCSSTRSGTPRPTCRRSCCARSRNTRCSRWAASARSRSTSAWSPPPTATSAKPCAPATFARTSSIASPWSR
jgi:ActR/RegA family two-component response regulator